MKKQGFLLSSAILIITVVITKILGLIYKIPLTNILGGEGFGYYSVAYSVFMPMFSMAVAGISTAMARLVSENAAFERYKNVRKIRRVSLVFFSAVGLCFTILTFIIALPVCVYIVKEPSAIWSVVAISPCIFIGAISAVERGYYEGLQNMTPNAISDIGEGIFKIVFGLGFAYLALKYQDRFFIKGLPFVAAMAIFGVTFSNLVSCLTLVIIQKIKGDGITRKMIEKDPSTDRMRELLQKIIRIAVPVAAAAVITTLSSFVDTITINRCLRFGINASPETFTARFGPGIDLKNLPNFIYGSYTGLALTIFGLVPSMTSIFGKSILPIISQDNAKGRKKEVSRRINSVLFINALISIPCAIGIYTFSEEILFTLFPNRQQEIIACNEALKILCAGMIFLCLAMPLYSIVQALAPPKTAVKIMLVSCLVKMLLNVLLVSIPELNIEGAGIATTISYGIIFLWSVYEIIRLSDVKIDYKKILIKPFFASLICVLTARMCYNRLIFSTNVLVSLMISVISGVIIYIFLLCLLSVLTKNELKCLFFK